MPPVSNAALAERLDSLIRDVADVKGDVHEIRALQVVANGRVSKIEMAREREAGAREAVAKAAASTAAALSVREKSRGWKIAVISAALFGIGTFTALGALVAQLLTH